METKLKNHLLTQYHLTDLAQRFVTDQKQTYDTVCVDIGGVHATYEYNASCHCHPEWTTETKDFPLEDFIAWGGPRIEEIFNENNQ